MAHRLALFALTITSSLFFLCVACSDTHLHRTVREMQKPDRCSRSGSELHLVQMLPITLIRAVFRWYENATILRLFSLKKQCILRFILLLVLTNVAQSFKPKITSFSFFCTFLRIIFRTNYILRSRLPLLLSLFRHIIPITVPRISGD